MGIKLYLLTIKRIFDFVLSIILLALFLPFLLILFIIVSIETKSLGIISQTRIGRYGKPFKLLKFKTMIDSTENYNHITTSKDPRITKFGAFLRQTKIDELPQLWNIFVGQMSFVGPRPDVPGYADTLEGDDRMILSLRPGLTGPASLVYKDEEYTLSNYDDPKKYNDEVIWPYKVIINKNYIKNYSLWIDFKILLQTLGFKL